MKSEPEICIAVLGDVHGHVTLAYRILQRWEREAGRKLDLILQVGDMGIFPPPFRLDRATMRFAEKDPDELGFVEYYEGSQEADDILSYDAPASSRMEADWIFVRGNHEDFIFLDEMKAAPGELVSVDAYGKILYLAEGVCRYQIGKEVVTIGALGGISHRGKPGQSARTLHYTKTEVRKLRAYGSGVDIFLSHEPPYGAARAIHPRYQHAGSEDVAQYIQEFAPTFHFCGHYHEACRALDVPGPTRSFVLHQVGFLKPHRLNPGCVGLLCRREGLWDFAPLDEPWLAEFTRWGWRESGAAIAEVETQ